ncbi:MAG: TrbG/VirB9 family P-type conjugative transfer protein, partial [Dongiaceae bacterium]
MMMQAKKIKLTIAVLSGALILSGAAAAQISPVAPPPPPGSVGYSGGSLPPPPGAMPSSVATFPAANQNQNLNRPRGTVSSSTTTTYSSNAYPPATTTRTVNTTGAVPPPPPPPGDLMMSGQERDIMEQSTGQYPVMERGTTASLGALQKAWDSPFAASGQATPGIVRFSWRPDYVMPLRTREFMVTTITMPAWEQIANVIVGDPVVFEARRIKNNILAIRPSHAGADTNLTVIGGSGSIYSFYIRSEGYNSDQITDITVYVDA